MSYVPTKWWSQFRRHVGHLTSIYHPPCRRSSLPTRRQRGPSAERLHTVPNRCFFKLNLKKSLSFSPHMWNPVTPTVLRSQKSERGHPSNPPIKTCMHGCDLAT
eukprot:sb/3478051/